MTKVEKLQEAAQKAHAHVEYYRAINDVDMVTFWHNVEIGYNNKIKSMPVQEGASCAQ